METARPSGACETPRLPSFLTNLRLTEMNADDEQQKRQDSGQEHLEAPRLPFKGRQ